MNLQDAYYEKKFEIEFLRTKGDAFQTFFERLMELAYKDDFMACRPWGNRGDRKNDGFLKSARCLFQVYAPNEMEESKAKAKIRADFEGAKQYWGDYFDTWVFVHNAADGLPQHVQAVLLEFEKVNPGVQLQPWGLEKMREIFRDLSSEDKESWFGPTPTEETRIGFADLQVVIESIAAQPLPLQTEVKDVPTGKIEANALSESAAYLLKGGMVKAPLVADFFSKWHDETLGEQLAEAFKIEYRRLHAQYSPNRIFDELLSWAGGERRGTPEHELAVLAILTYYFERCDIFEEPRRNI